MCNETTMFTIVCRSMRWFGTISAAIALGLFLLVVPAHSLSVADYIAALGDKNPKVRRASLEKILEAYVKYDECDLACLSTEEAAIVGFSPDDFSKLTTAVIKLLSDPDPKIRGLAIQYSASSTDARVLEPVARLLSDVNDEVRAMATGLFEFYPPNNDEIISQLEHLLKDKTARVRTSAARALGNYGNKRSLRFLREAAARESDAKAKEILGLMVEELQKRFDSIKN